MSWKPLARSLVLGITLALTAPSAWAAPVRPSEEAGPARSLVMQLWQAFTAGWSDVGCWIDPYGGCGSTQALAPPPEAEAGCIIDPYGGCSGSQAQIEEGCWIDPHGGCRQGQSAPAADAGCGLDPYGGCSH